MKSSTYIFILLLFSKLILFSQIPQIPQPPLVLAPLSLSTGTHIKQNSNAIISQQEVTNDANVTYKAGNKIQLLPGFRVNGLSNTGKFHAVIQPNDFEVVSMNAAGWTVPKYEKMELGLKLPTAIQSQIDNFFVSNGTSGLNPYDANHFDVIFYFTINGTQYKRNAFYYRDFTVANNYWQEQATDYKMRVRFAPPQTGIATFFFEVWINGVLQNPGVYSNAGEFTVTAGTKHGHLTTNNTNNTRKFFFEDGTPFFGIGQNLWANGDNEPNCLFQNGNCLCPATYTKLRSWVNDLADNGGNFTRLRIDNNQFPIMWPNQQYQVGDPPPDADLSKYLLNYDNNQKHMWELDQTFNVMENRGVYTILSLLEDQNYKIHNGYAYIQSTDQWAKNPYSAILGQGFANCKSFFTDANAQAIFKNYLNYVIARWGYSTSMGGWMMINETINVADMANGPFDSIGNFTPSTTFQAPYTTDLTFRANVDTWICSMKNYMEQQYPWHPTTTGLTETELTGTNRLPCLNFWSRNDYTNYVGDDNPIYYLRDYNRNATVHGYYTDDKPFIWGELGMPDNTSFIDKYNDRTFHNANWISVVSGALGTGMYWNDMNQDGGTNHRANFKAIKTFANDVDWSVQWNPYFNGNDFLGTNYNGKRVFTFSALSNDNYALAFAVNNASHWANEDPSVYNVPNSKPFAQLAAEQGIELPQDKYDIVADINTNPPVKIKGFNPSMDMAIYKVDIYKTYGNGGVVNTVYPMQTYNQLQFALDMPFDIGPDNYPDYAFIARPYSVFRTRDTLALNGPDSVNLTQQFIKNTQNYNISYNFGNGSSITNSVAITSYPNQGNYTATLTVTNKINDTTAVYYQHIKVIGNTTKMEQAVVSLYPNPSMGSFSIAFDEQLFANPNIRVFNQLGKLVAHQPVVPGKVNLPNLSNGLYFIQFYGIGYQKNLKLVVQN